MAVSVQRYADEVLAPEYRQPVKTLLECVREQGWAEVDHPDCCDVPLTIRGFLGSPHFIQCKACGKFAVDVTGPSFRNGAVWLLDGDKVDLTSERCWIAGTQPLAEIDP